MKRVSTIPKSHLFLPEDLHLFDYHQIFSVSTIWIEEEMENVIATFDLSVRDMPKNRNFMMFGGLEEILEGIRQWRYTEDEVKYLLKNTVITKKMADRMHKFKFHGDIWAMPEGTIFFPGETVVRLTGPIWEINLMTMFLMNTLTNNTLYFTKIVRSFLAAQEKIAVLTCPMTRAHANEASFKFARAAYILGTPAATVVPAFARKYNLPMSHVSTKAYHAMIKSFPSELEAMRVAARIYPNRIDFMVDTYDFRQGVRNAIKVQQELQRKGQTITGVTIDSGKTVQDYIDQAVWVRKMLDSAGFPKIRITVAGNFDEWKIAELVTAKAPVNGVIIGTEVVTVADAPKLETVFKLAELRQAGKVFYKAKLAPGKESYPARKQVYRQYRKGIMTNDIIGLENERQGTPLLKKMIANGGLTYKLPSLYDLRDFVKKEINTLPLRLQRIDREYPYSVKISSALQALFKQVKTQHQGHGEDAE